ncbi:MAG: metalloregulator ArsR/SmtB family transcription factor [Polyangiales bacterium]
MVITPTRAAGPDGECEDHAHTPTRRARMHGVHAEKTLARAAGFFRAAGEVARLRLLSHLMDGEWCVSELAAALDEGMSTISQRLRILRAEGLVERRREGKHVYYMLADAHVASLLESALAHAAEEHGASPSPEEKK